MKKSYRWALVILVLAFACSSFFIGKGIWKIWENYQNQIVERYSWNISSASCTINVLRNGEIDVYAHDYNWHGKYVSQFVAIDAAEHKIREYRSFCRQGEQPALYRSGGYDIFYAKFRPYASKLPPEVRAKFGGQWGIE